MEEKVEHREISPHFVAKISSHQFILCSVLQRPAFLQEASLKTDMAVEPAAKRRRLSPPTEDGAAIPGFAKWNLEQEYEQRPRKKRKDEDNRLPIKKGGKVERDTRPDAHVEEVVEDEGSGVDEDAEDSAVADVQPAPEIRKPHLSAKEEIRQAKEELARIAALISESPEEHVGLFSSLAQLADSESVAVKKLALGTQLAVYKDIIPGYRIRPLSKDDMQAKLSKEVKRLRNFEQGLLGGYKYYVQTLGRLSKASADGHETRSLALLAISCACALLTNVPHFNCRNDLIGILVNRLCSREVDAGFVKCQEALEQLFRDDEEGHASLEAVSQLTKMMKSKNYNINENALNTFLHLRLLSEFAHKASTNHIDKDDENDSRGVKQAKQKREFRTKRERKLLRERKEVAKEMKEADAAVSYEERDKNQAETLKLVFVTYFRILKARTQHLMGAVLEGLAKYAHLINQDFFGDVLEALKDLINDALASPGEDEADGESEQSDTTQNRNATRESLLCIITAFALLQGQNDVAKSANSLHLDLNFFITHLYRTLLPFSLDQDIEMSSKTTHLSDPNGLTIPTNTKVNVSTTTVLLLRSLSAVLIPPTSPKAVPPLRIAAFVKQLHTLALHLPQKSCVALMGLLQQVSKVHGGRIAALWNTEERRGDGVFDALSEGVEGSNPFAATLWEGQLLRWHFDPRVREAVKSAERHVGEAR